MRNPGIYRIPWIHFLRNCTVLQQLTMKLRIKPTAKGHTDWLDVSLFDCMFFVSAYRKCHSRSFTVILRFADIYDLWYSGLRKVPRSEKQNRGKINPFGPVIFIQFISKYEWNSARRMRSSFYLLSFLRFDPNGSWNNPFKMRCVVIEAFRFHPERKNNPQNVKSGSKSIIHLTIFL